MRRLYFAGAVVIIVLLIVFLLSAPTPAQKPRVASISTSSAQTVLGQTTKTTATDWESVYNRLPGN